MTFIDSILDRLSWTIRRIPDRFKLGWWFMAISLILIVSNSVLFAWILAGFLSKQMIERDAVVSMEYVNSIVEVQRATEYFYGIHMGAKVPEMEEFFRHVASIPDVIRANVYGEDRTILWSSSPAMIGKKFQDNEDLERAFRGELHPELKATQRQTKTEHVNFPPEVTDFIEYYLPIWAGGPTRVVGAVEIYKSPTELLDTIRTGQLYVWLGSLGAALVLYAAIGTVAWHTREVLREQEARTIESERLAVVGEMASAVAHGLRNPLAAIRSCAELVLEDDIGDDVRRPLKDIVDQSDRLERWIRSFLKHATQGGSDEIHPIPIDAVLESCIESFRSQLQAREIVVSKKFEGDSPLVIADASEMSQVFNSMISNSVEAIQERGAIVIERGIDSRGMVQIAFIDSGPGFNPEILAKAFQAFTTTKNSGVGVGLALAKRIVERLGGTIILSNENSQGAKVLVQIPAMRLV
ncbi:MAG: ATP-binding protein [Burkholderiaceae bacterium]